MRPIEDASQAQVRAQKGAADITIPDSGCSLALFFWITSPAFHRLTAQSVFAIAFNGSGGKITFVRELQTDEIATHSRLMPIVAEARERLSLFRILGRNYQEWSAELERARKRDSFDLFRTRDELNRLLLNYLTAAYTIREHFGVSYKKRFRKDSIKLNEHDATVDRICLNCWSFAFFLDYRGYVQHCGLGLLKITARDAPDGRIDIQLEAPASHLLAQSRSWQRSKLDASHRSIDLVLHLSAFHRALVTEYGSFLATMLFPELLEAEIFYGRLSAEARSQDPGASLVFMDNLPELQEAGPMLKATLDFKLVPNAVFHELGLDVSVKLSRSIEASSAGQ